MKHFYEVDNVLSYMQSKRCYWTNMNQN